MTVADGAPGEVVFRDATAPLTAGSGCAAAADGAVACPLKQLSFPPTGVEVRAGDGDDRVLLSTSARVFGEAGTDVLEATTAGATLDGAEGDDTLIGGPGSDMLVGGPGADKLTGGAGADSLTGDTGDDALDGGEGSDRLLMPGQRDVIVDLGAGIAGGPGEHDAIAGFERVVTGDGDDHVIGSEGDDDIDTGPGDDAVDGRGGNDLIDGGSGTDLLDGGRGTTACASPRARAARATTSSRVCTRRKRPPTASGSASRGAMLVTRVPARFSRQGVRFTVTCPGPDACAVRLTVKTRHGTVVARAAHTLRIAPGTSSVAKLRLTRDGRRILRARRVSVRVLAGSQGWRATWHQGPAFADMTEALQAELAQTPVEAPAFTRAEVLSIEVGEQESQALIRYSGDGGGATVRSHWRDEGGRPRIAPAWTSGVATRRAEAAARAAGTRRRRVRRGARPARRR